MKPLVEVTVTMGGALEIEPLGIARVAPPDNFVDEATISIQGVEVARPAQQQRVLDRPQLHSAAERAVFEKPLKRVQLASLTVPEGKKSIFAFNGITLAG
jgi:hypothetical protein